MELTRLPLAGEGGLVDILRGVRDPRRRNGMRHPGRALLAGAICAVLSGCRSVRAIAEWLEDQPETVRRALGFNRPAVQLVSAVTHTDGVTLGQMTVEGGNEIGAANRLLAALNLSGKTITFDALHTQRETASLIVHVKHADYVMTVKGNQPSLLMELENAPTALFSPCP